MIDFSLMPVLQSRATIIRLCQSIRGWRILAACLAIGLTPVIVEGQDARRFNASVTIGKQVLNRVRPEIFGDNMEWANDGMGFWNPLKKAVDPELVRMAKEVGITHLRYPGGTLSDYFHWQWAVGDQRRSEVNPFNKGATAPPNFGPDEFMDLCKKLGIRASITLNAGTGSPEEAAAWVQYNDAHHYPVIDYEFGNEVYMRSTDGPGLNIDKTPQQYIDLFRATERAIHKVSPNAKIGAVGLVDTGKIPLCKDPKWIEKILTGLGDKIDFLAIHNGYAPVIRSSGFSPSAPRASDDGFVAAMLAAPIYIRDNLMATEALIARCCPSGGKNLGIHITESGPLIYPIGNAHDVEDIAWNRSIAGALYQAGLFHVLMSDPKVTSVNHLPLSQDVFGALIGIHQAGLSRTVWRNVVSYVFEMYSRLAGSKILATFVVCPTRSTPTIGIVPALEKAPLIDACAFEMPNRRLVLMLINRSVDRSALVKVHPSFSRVQVQKVTTLSSPNYKDANLPDSPRRVMPSERRGIGRVETGSISLILPKCSLTCIELTSK